VSDEESDKPLAVRSERGGYRDVKQNDAIVLAIADQLVSGLWIEGISVRQLAHRLNIPVATANHHVAVAKRYLRLANEDGHEDRKARNLARLDSVYADARADGEHRAAVAAVEAQNGMLGLAQRNSAQVYA